MPMNYGISITACFSKAREFIKLKNLHEIYLNLLDYFINFASENKFKIIEIASVPPFDSDVLYKDRYEIKEKIKKFETTYHLPAWEINIGALNPSIRKVSINETKKLIDIAKDIGVKKISMHPGSYTSMNVYSLFKEKVKVIALESIFDIFEYCKDKGIELQVENLSHNTPIFKSPDEFEPLVEKGIGMLLDTAHAITAGVDPIEFIEKFGNKISEVHLVDGFKGKEDIHYALGIGDVNYVAVLDELQKIEYKGPIILELKSEKDALDSLERLKKNKYL